jgi:hypothetical protein
MQLFNLQVTTMLEKKISNTITVAAFFKGEPGSSVSIVSA